MITPHDRVRAQQQRSAMVSQVEHQRVLMQIEALLLTGAISCAMIAGELDNAAEHTQQLLTLLETRRLEP